MIPAWPGGLAAALLAAASSLLYAATDAARPASRLDLERYAGVWFEIARVPEGARSRCTGDVTVNYAVRKDGRMAVTQRCRTSDGSFETLRGTARRESGDTSGTRLEMNFAPRWLHWLPLGWTEHWVVAIDPGYEIAVASDRDRKQLWLMARSPHVDEERLDALLAGLRAQGFAVDRLVRTPHHAGALLWRRVRVMT